MQRLSKHWIFIVLLILGLVLRIIFISEQGFSNDELSAWYRTKFSDWDSFWTLGVKTGDMHPAFYQVLLWFWVRIFGDTEFSIRATSLLFYVLNSYLIYRISCKHFTQLSGLLLQGLYVGLTFMVINTVFARPYNSGTFFLLLAFWAVLELKTSENKWKWTALLSMGLLGAMLSHYFAFFVALILGVLALFNVGKKNIPKVLIAGSAASLLFLPHLQITLFQINRGGLGWLAPPDLNWSFNFLYLFFNESWILFSILALVFVIWLIIYRTNKWSGKNTFSVAIFLSAFVGAYIVSYLFTPILRDLVMLFILPFAILPLLSLIKDISQKKSLMLIAFVTLLPVTDSLLRYKLLEPVHFGVFKENGIKINELTRKYGKENITYASNYNNINYINYYVENDLTEKIIDWDQADALYTLVDRAKNSQTKFFCYSFSNKYHVPMFLEVIRKYYPVTISSMTTKYTCVYLFGKSGKKSENTSFYFKEATNTTFVNDEFLNEVKIPVKDLPKLKDKNFYYLFSCTGEMKDTIPFHLVITVERDDQILLNGKDPKVYIGYDQSRLIEVAKSQEFFTAFELPDDLKPTDILKAYCWNPEKGSVKTSSVRLSVVKVKE